MADTLDETDLQILKTLQRNAKLTTKELADAVHLTPTPVFERQKRLERQGYIKKYVAILDPGTRATRILQSKTSTDQSRKGRCVCTSNHAYS